MSTASGRLRPVGALLLASVLAADPAFANWPSSPLANLPVCETIGQQVPGGIVSDGLGGALITWSDTRLGSDNADIYVQRVLASGVVDPAWPFHGQLLCTAAGNQLAPGIVSDGAGGAIVAWQDLRSGTNYDIYAQHVRAGGIVDPAWPRNGRVVCGAAGNQVAVAIVADGAAGAVVTWRDFRGGTTQAVYAERVLANGSLDLAWPVDGRALLSQPNTFDRPGAIPTLAFGSNGAIVVWEDFSGGATADLRAQHVRGDGTLDPAWPAGGRFVCGALNDQLDPRMVSDGGLGAVICWDDARGANVDIYAQHLKADGTLDPVWPADGRQVCAAVGDQRAPAEAADGSGGVLIAWADLRVGTTPNIYAQHVFASGSVDAGWPVNGRAVSTANADQSSPVATGDGAGGVLLVWSDSRLIATAPDVYSQHVLASGALDPTWPIAGSPVCTVTGTQFGVLAIPDGIGGVIMTWNDQRGGELNSDVYAQRVQANGTLGGSVVVGVPFDPALALSLDAVEPNPWQGGVLRIEYSLQSDSPATLEVVDVAGRRVATRTITSAGSGRGSARLELGQRLSPGVYLVALRQGTRVQMRRFVVLE